MDELAVKWPARTFAFYAQVRASSKTILSDTILAIDPSSGGSSQPGYAIFTAGKLVKSGELKLPGNKPIHTRLGILYDKLQELTDTPPAILVTEDVSLGKMSHHYLKWAVGVTLAAARAKDTLICPINCWRAVAKAMPVYTKTNTTDAVLIGQTVILLAKKFQEEENERISRHRRKRLRTAYRGKTGR